MRQVIDYWWAFHEHNPAHLCDSSPSTLYALIPGEAAILPIFPIIYTFLYI